MFSKPEKNIEQFGIDPGMKVADLGSGAGFYSIVLSKAVGESGKVFAVDVQQSLLVKLKNQAVQENITNLDIVWGDIEEKNGSTLREESLDRVIIANTLFQTNHKDVVLNEAKRILKPKGMLLIVDWEDSFGGLGPQPHYLFKKDQALALINSSGFELLREIEAGDHHYGLVCKKI